MLCDSLRAVVDSPMHSSQVVAAALALASPWLPSETDLLYDFAAEERRTHGHVRRNVWAGRLRQVVCGLSLIHI